VINSQPTNSGLEGKEMTLMSLRLSCKNSGQQRWCIRRMQQHCKKSLMDSLFVFRRAPII